MKAKHGKPKHPAHEVVVLTNAGTRKRLVYHAPSPGNAAGLALNRDDVRQVISSRLAGGTKGGES